MNIGIKWMMFWVVLLGVHGNVWAVPLHRYGCDTPLTYTRLCWESSGEVDEEADVVDFSTSPKTTFSELHILPVMAIGVPDGVLVEYSQAIYRQLSGSGLAVVMQQEWQPVGSLEEAIYWTRSRQWPYALWFLPRAMRESSSANPGVIDLQAYIIKGKEGMVERITRIRVESHPSIRLDYDALLTSMGIMDTVGLISEFGWLKGVGLLGKVGMESHRAPESGFSLELLTETLIRHLILILRTPLLAMASPKS